MNQDRDPLIETRLDKKQSLNTTIKNKILKNLNKFKVVLQMFLNKKLNKYVVVAVLSSILSSMLVYSIITNYKVDPRDKYLSPHKEFGVSIQQRLDELKKGHNYYTKVATKEELMVKWIEMFSRSRYRRDGNPKYNEYDCISAVIHFFWRWNSNIFLENVKALKSRSEKLSALSQLEIRKTYTRVKPGDIIIFNPIRGNWHCGIIYDKKNGYILFMDVNAVIMGSGMGQYKFKNWKEKSDRINMIIEPSYSLWIGNLLQRLNK